MKRSRAVGGSIAALVLVFVGIQFVPVERSNPPVKVEISAPETVDTIIRRACWDCHSNETRWPWYSHVAPISWFVIGHVNEGRGDLNFSEWPAFDFEEQRDTFKDIQEQIRKGEMPLATYTLLHREAVLSQEDRETLIRWAQSGGSSD